MSGTLPARRRARAAAERTDSRQRAAGLAVIAVALSALLAAGAAFTTTEPSSAFGQRAPSLLAVADLSTAEASVWNCPGPLPLSDGSRSSVTVADPTDRAATAQVVVAETEVTGAAGTGRPLGARSLTLRLRPESAETVPLVADRLATSAPHSGGRSVSGSSGIVAAVSVTVSGAGVAVSESTVGTAGRLATGCALGSSTEGYLAAGSTRGASDGSIALFNPAATPAVVSVAVASSDGLAEPAGLQGLVVGPERLVVVDVAHFVPQRSVIALSVSAAVGRVVLGLLAETNTGLVSSLAGRKRHETERGAGLVVGVGRALSHLELPLGPIGPADTEALRLFDPGREPAVVRVSTSTAGAQPATLTVHLGAGVTEEVFVPVVRAPGTTRAGTTGSLTSRRHHGVRLVRLAAGTIVVSSAGGIGVVVSHETFELTSAGHYTVVTSAPPVYATSAAVLPTTYVGRSEAESVLLTDASRRAEVVKVVALAPAAGGASRVVATERVAAGGSLVVPLALVPGLSGGLLLEGDGPFMATAELSVTGGSPGLETAIPAL